MVQGPPVSALEALRNTSASIDEHIAILKQLKMDIVGHRQRKELVVKQGAVEGLVRFISTPYRDAIDGQAGRGKGWSQEDEARLQATLILGSLAGAGPAFMQPLLAANVPEGLLASLHAGQPLNLFLATLQALRALAQQSNRNVQTDDSAQVNVINSRSLPMLELILRKQLNAEFTQLFQLALDIITLSATTEETCNEILESGVWTPLLGIFADSIRSQSDWCPFHPGEVHTAQKILPKVLSSIAAIIGGSNYRAQCFIHHPTMRSLVANGLPLPLNELLPEVPLAPLKPGGFSGGASASFPAFGSPQTNGRDGQAAPPNAFMVLEPAHPHQVCLMLVAIVKLVPGNDCLPVLRLLATVNNAMNDSQSLFPQTTDQQQRSRQRDRYVAMCAVPVAIRLLQTASEKNDVDGMTVAERESRRQLKVDSCEVLASLVRTSKDLQVAAVEAGAIKRICPVLKKSFDAVVSTKPMWSSKSSKAGDEGSSPPTSRLGSPGLPSEIEYAMHCRAAALEAIAALANKEDVHRQAIVQAGVVSCIIDSLKPLPASEVDKLAKVSGKMTPDSGNTTQVIMAACHAAQSMSRSVSLLRTSLIDAGIAKPIFELLKHPALVVRVAATEVCCNLVLEFSPMREDLLAAGAIKTLTEHARQSEMGLRLSSLWALKHLVLSATREIKIQTLDELGVGWLVAAVHGQQRSEMQDVASGGVVLNASGGLSAPNAAGERVDLLNPSSMDVDDPPAGDADAEDGEILYDEAAMTHYRASHMRSTLNQQSSAKKESFDTKRHLESVRDREQDSVRRAHRDDIAVQEQGLDFIRNMLNGDDCAYMLEHLLNQIGMTQLFAMLTEKLTPLNPQQSSTRNSNANASRSIYPPNELILSTIHVITHIANGSPQQKQLLIAQKPLLSAWLPHFHHPDSRVRCISVWAVNSLTWIEDEHDRPAAQQRARELRNIGITGAVEGLRGDADMDVRERVRVAVRQIDALG